MDAFNVGGQLRASPCPTRTVSVTPADNGRFLFACREEGAYLCDGLASSGAYPPTPATCSALGLLGCAATVYGVTFTANFSTFYVACLDSVAQCSWAPFSWSPTDCTTINAICPGTGEVKGVMLPPNDDGNLFLSCFTSGSASDGGLFHCPRALTTGAVGACAKRGQDPCREVYPAVGSVNAQLTLDSGGMLVVACIFGGGAYCDFSVASGASGCGGVVGPSPCVFNLGILEASGVTALACYLQNYFICDSLANPTDSPTGRPTLLPTAHPSVPPTRPPSKPPSTPPSARPTLQPTPLPTGAPIRTPTQAPATAPPSEHPTRQPTHTPTGTPTHLPTQAPATAPPSERPTRQPTPAPTGPPTQLPTRAPTRRPSLRPTTPPSGAPTRPPSPSPTARPPHPPTLRPTMPPVASPPSMAPATWPPSPGPTAAPSGRPAAAPTGRPSLPPSARPTAPSQAPAAPPSAAPASSPPAPPSSGPSGAPLREPTDRPSSGPSAAPSSGPSVAPSSSAPTPAPAATPSAAPASPTSPPTATPAAPSAHPRRPSGAPSGRPTAPPARTGAPSARPTRQGAPPSGGPTTQPTHPPRAAVLPREPSLRPLSAPTAVPAATAGTSTLTPLLPPEGEPPLALRKVDSSVVTATAGISSMAAILSQDVMTGTQGPKMARFFDYASCPPDDHADLGFISNPTGAGKRSRGGSSIGQKDDGSKEGPVKDDDEGALAERRGAMLANLGLVAAFVTCNACCGLAIALIKKLARGHGSLREGLATARFPSFSFFPALFMYQNVLEPAFHLLIFGGRVENQIIALACATVISMVPVSIWMMTGPDHLRVKYVADEAIESNKLGTFLWGSHKWVSSAEDPTFERRFALIFKDFRAPYKRFLLVDVVVVTLISLVSAFVARNATHCSIQISTASLIEIAYLGVVCKCRPFIADLDHWYTIVLTACQVCAIILALVAMHDDHPGLLMANAVLLVLCAVLMLLKSLFDIGTFVRDRVAECRQKEEEAARRAAPEGDEPMMLRANSHADLRLLDEAPCSAPPIQRSPTPVSEDMPTMPAPLVRERSRRLRPQRSQSRLVRTPGGVPLRPRTSSRVLARGQTFSRRALTPTPATPDLFQRERSRSVVDLTEGAAPRIPTPQPRALAPPPSEAPPRRRSLSGHSIPDSDRPAPVRLSTFRSMQGRGRRASLVSVPEEATPTSDTPPQRALTGGRGHRMLG